MKDQLTERQGKAYDLAAERDELCTVCRFEYNCHGLKNYGNGPSYPPCADGEPDQFVDFNALDEYLDGDDDAE